ncbi:hypothetical protein ACFQ0T_05220 [Kitasatospora gansuensis]
MIRRVTAGVAVVGAPAVGLFWWALLSLPGDADPPDVTAMANAPATRAADRSATELTDSQLGLLHARTPWAEQLGTSAADVCFSRSRSGSFGSGGARWDPVSCRRAAPPTSPSTVRSGSAWTNSTARWRPWAGYPTAARG